MSQGKFVVDADDLRKLLNLPREVQITHLGLSEDPYLVWVYVQGDQVPESSDIYHVEHPSSERQILRRDLYERSA